MWVNLSNAFRKLRWSPVGVIPLQNKVVIAHQNASSGKKKMLLYVKTKMLGKF